MFIEPETLLIEFLQNLTIQVLIIRITSVKISNPYLRTNYSIIIKKYFNTTTKLPSDLNRKIVVAIILLMFNSCYNLITCCIRIQPQVFTYSCKEFTLLYKVPTYLLDIK